MELTMPTPTATMSLPTVASVRTRVSDPRAVYRRRRLIVFASFLGFVLALTVLFGSAGAQAELEDPVGGHVVVEPGETLWDVAAETAPTGIATQDQLQRIVELNGFTSSEVPAWTVVLVPRR